MRLPAETSPQSTRASWRGSSAELNRQVRRRVAGAVYALCAGGLFAAGSSPGVHAQADSVTVQGTGLSFTTLGVTLSASYAYGEEHRMYVKLGQPW
jgi:hypothetical protein